MVEVTVSVLVAVPVEVPEAEPEVAGSVGTTVVPMLPVAVSVKAVSVVSGTRTEMLVEALGPGTIKVSVPIV